MKRKTKWIACASAVSLVGALFCCWYLSQRNKWLLADMLGIERLPKGARIVSIRKDLLPDTVVSAHLVVPAGTVTNLITGHPFVESDPLQVIGGRHWGCRYSNAHFWVKCDETGRSIEVFCAVD